MIMYTDFSKKNKDKFMDDSIYKGMTAHGGMSYLNNLYMKNLGDKKFTKKLDAATSYLSDRRVQEAILKSGTPAEKQKAKDRIKELDMIAQYKYGGKFDLNGVGKKKKKDKNELYEYDGPIAGEYRSQIIENGHVNTDKLIALATAGAIGAAAIVKFAKMAAERGATKKELEAIERAKLIAGQQASGSNYSEDINMENIFVGNNGVAIVGSGAAEALADTMGQYADYAEQPGMIELGVDSLIAAQVTKHDNAESFAETDEVAVQDCIYSVGDEVEICEGIAGKVVEVLPLPASFSDSTVTSQILLDNGVLANVTESGKCWIEMSEDGTPITTPLCKYNYLNVDGQQFSMVELGFIDPDYAQLNDFSVDDYAVAYEGETAENFGEDNEVPPAANTEPAKPAENTNASENTPAAPEANTAAAEPAKPAENTNASENTDANDGAPAPAPAAATEPAADPNAASATFSQENENQEANTVNFSADDYNTGLDEILAFANTPDAR